MIIEVTKILNMIEDMIPEKEDVVNTEDTEVKEVVVKTEETTVVQEERSTTMGAAAGQRGAPEKLAGRLCTIGSLLQASPWLLAPH